MFHSDLNGHAAACQPVPEHTFDRLIADVASGRQDAGRTWHRLRNARPPLTVWMAFAAAAVGQGRKYDHRWATHQWRCWTQLSDEGTYPQQRSKWCHRQSEWMATQQRKQVAA